MSRLLLTLMLASLPGLAQGVPAPPDCCPTKEHCCKDTCCTVADHCCKVEPRKPCAKNCNTAPMPKAVLPQQDPTDPARKDPANPDHPKHSKKPHKDKGKSHDKDRDPATAPGTTPDRHEDRHDTRDHSGKTHP